MFLPYHDDHQAPPPGPTPSPVIALLLAMFCQNLTHFVAPLPQLTFPPPPTPPPSSDETSPSEDDGSGDDDKTESYNPDHVHHNKRSGGSEGGSASKRGRIGTNGTGVGMGRSSQVEVTFGDVVSPRYIPRFIVA